MRDFLRRFFGKGHAPWKGDGTPDGDWGKGDLAVCIHTGPWTDIMSGKPSGARTPVTDQVYRVAASDFCNGVHVLNLAEFPATHWHTALSFRKAVLNHREACETEFVTLLKRSKRKVSA